MGLVPKEFGSKTAVHEFYQKLNSRGVFRRIVAIVAAKAEAAGKYLFNWQSMDGVILQAPARVSMNHDQGFGANPTDRGRKGSKLHLWCAQNSLPISVTVHGANVHDSKLVIPSLKNAFIDFEVMGKGDSPNNICMDKAYDSKLVRDQVRENGMIPHVRSRGEEKKEKYDTPARRWVVERLAAWFKGFRSIRTRYTCKLQNFVGDVLLACIKIIGRRLDLA